MRRFAVAVGLLLLISGCSSNNALDGDLVPISSMTGGTKTQSASPNVAYTTLGKAIDDSIYQAYQNGVVESFSVKDQLSYVEVYDPNAKFDYKGAGWIAESDEVELVLELDMFALWQMQTAYASVQQSDVRQNADGTITMDIALDHFPKRATFTIDATGLVVGIDYEDETHRVITVSYAIDTEAAAIIRRANEDNGL